jgi:hypothetical protein
MRKICSSTCALAGTWALRNSSGTGLLVRSRRVQDRCGKRFGIPGRVQLCCQGGVLLLNQLFQEQSQAFLALQVFRKDGATGGHAVEDEGVGHGGLPLLIT